MVGFRHGSRKAFGIQGIGNLSPCSDTDQMKMISFEILEVSRTGLDLCFSCQIQETHSHFTRCASKLNSIRMNDCNLPMLCWNAFLSFFFSFLESVDFLCRSRYISTTVSQMLAIISLSALKSHKKFNWICVNKYCFYAFLIQEKIETNKWIEQK